MRSNGSNWILKRDFVESERQDRILETMDWNVAGDSRRVPCTGKHALYV